MNYRLLLGLVWQRPNKALQRLFRRRKASWQHDLNAGCSGACMKGGLSLYASGGLSRAQNQLQRRVCPFGRSKGSSGKGEAT